MGILVSQICKCGCYYNIFPSGHNLNRIQRPRSSNLGSLNGLRDPGTPNKLCGRIHVWGSYIHVPGKTVHNFHQILQGVCEQRV